MTELDKHYIKAIRKSSFTKCINKAIIDGSKLMKKLYKDEHHTFKHRNCHPYVMHIYNAERK